MAATIEEITIGMTEDGVETVKELDKEVLTKGAWSTIVFRYQEWDAKKGEYSPDRYTIRRYRKRAGEYKQQSKFNISSKEQAQALIATLEKWFDKSV